MSNVAPNQRVSTRLPSNGVVIPHAPRWYQWVAAWGVVTLTRAMTATLRFRWRDESGFFEGPVPRPVIFCCWHNRLASTMACYFGYVRKRSRTAGLAAMVSTSKDGAFLAAILRCFSVQPVRGSSSRRGPQALLELTSWAERGFDLAITPDGPRGPRYVVQEGVMSLAQLTGLPIIPSSINLMSKIQVRSWDRFQIPLPFSRCELWLGKPLYVPREATDSEREALRQQLESSLREISRD